jgi:predicted permease
VLTRFRSVIGMLGAFFRRGKLEDRLRDELQFHIDLLTDKNIRLGMAPDEARRQARIAVGGFEQARETVRDARGFGFLEDIGRDFRYGLRQLRRSPGFAVVSMLTLALGIGANTAIFSVMKGVILSSLPYPEPERLVRISATDARRGFSNMNVSYPDFVDWTRTNHSLESAALFEGTLVNLTGSGEPEGLPGVRASSSLFTVLQRSPAHGRTFAPDEDKPGAERVVIISHGLWQRRFAGDPHILGTTISLDGAPHTVIGIMPADFFFPDPRNDIWLPQRIDPAKAERGSRGYSAAARLKKGVSLELARADLAGIVLGLARRYPASNEGLGVSLLDLRRVSMGENVIVLMIIVYLAVTFVLLIACTNVANLLLARATSRQKEIVIRMSLGSGRLRVLRQLLTESVVLALLGSAGGIFVSFWCVKALLEIAPPDMPNRDRIVTDQAALFYAIGLALVCGLLFGLAPAFQSTGRRAIQALREGGRASAGRARHRLLNAFVVAEVALVVVLLVCCGLMVRSFAGQMAVEPGFNPSNLLTVRMLMPEYRYGQPAQQTAFLRDVLARSKNIPGIQAIAAVQTLPLEGSSWSNTFSVEGHPPALPGAEPNAGLMIVSPDYFRTMGIPLLLGRFFSENDDEAQPVAIINQTMARRYLESNPLGRRISLGGTDGKWMPIVGVVADVHHLALGAPPRPEIYVAHPQQPTRRMVLVARTSSEPLGYAGALRSAIWSVDPDQPVSIIRSMEQVVRESVSNTRAAIQVMSILSLFALVLAGMGIYGVISYAVGERTQEIGIRMAFGAQPGDISRMILRRGMSLILIGLAIGSAGAFASMRLLSSRLYGVTPGDPISYAATAIALLMIAFLAMLVPVRRALSVDPVIALRSE